MRVESVLGSVLECVPCARVSNQIIVYTSPNYRNKINSATHSESLQGDPLWSRTDFLECMISSSFIYIWEVCVSVFPYYGARYVAVEHVLS